MMRARRRMMTRLPKSRRRMPTSGVPRRCLRGRGGLQWSQLPPPHAFWRGPIFLVLAGSVRAPCHASGPSLEHSRNFADPAFWPRVASTRGTAPPRLSDSPTPRLPDRLPDSPTLRFRLPNSSTTPGLSDDSPTPRFPDSPTPRLPDSATPRPSDSAPRLRLVASPTPRQHDSLGSWLIVILLGSCLVFLGSCSVFPGSCLACFRSFSS